MIDSEVSFFKDPKHVFIRIYALSCLEYPCKHVFTIANLSEPQKKWYQSLDFQWPFALTTLLAF